MSWKDDPATARQYIAITRLEVALGRQLPEQRLTKGEARRVMYDLRRELKRKGSNGD